MVQRQIKRWPYHDVRRQFTGKVNMGIMRSILLNQAFGFTKQRPATLAPRAGLGPGQDSESHTHSTSIENKNKNKNKNKSRNGNKNESDLAWGMGADETAHGVCTPLPVQGKPAIYPCTPTAERSGRLRLRLGRPHRRWLGPLQLWQQKWHARQRAASEFLGVHSCAPNYLLTPSCSTTGVGRGLSREVLRIVCASERGDRAEGTLRPAHVGQCHCERFDG